MRTRAVLEGDSWVIRGDKQFITQGSTAGIYVIMASTDPSQGTKGISAFIVPRETPGLNVGKLEKNWACARRTPPRCISTTCACRRKIFSAG